MGKSICSKLVMLKTVPQLKIVTGRRLQASFFCPSVTAKTAFGSPDAVFVFRGQISNRRFTYLKQDKTTAFHEGRRGALLCRTLYMAYFCVCLSVFLVQPAAAANIWEKASEIMQDVYSQILTISTIAAIVTASVALLMMNFSRSGRTVDESRAWIKRIIITWAILNGLGFIMSYVTPFFAGGQWTPTTTP